MASMSSSSNTSIPPSWLSENTSSTLRDASFSSYLDTTEENYIRSLVTTIQKPIPKMMTANREIDVFRADKYFNEEVHPTVHPKDAKSHQHRENNVITSLSNWNLQPRTPSIHSESSLNSQSVLVKRAQRNKNSFKGRKLLFFSAFYCCNKKSVVIDDQDQYNNNNNASYYDDRGVVSTRTIKTSFDTSEITRFNKLRMNNTFSFPISKKEDEFNREMKSWEAFPVRAHYDSESDASSDLFEIECFSSAASSALVVPSRREYEPSEASVEWSVVTASAVDFSNVSDSESDSEEQKMSVSGKSRASLKIGMIGGCKSRKAVRVVTGNSKSDQRRKVQRFPDSNGRQSRRTSASNLYM